MTNSDFSPPAHWADLAGALRQCVDAARRSASTSPVRRRSLFRAELPGFIDAQLDACTSRRTDWMRTMETLATAAIDTPKPALERVEPALRGIEAALVGLAQARIGINEHALPPEWACLRPPLVDLWQDSLDSALRHTDHLADVLAHPLAAFRSAGTCNGVLELELSLHEPAVAHDREIGRAHV